MNEAEKLILRLSVEGLEEDAREIRNDWSDFDGRSNLSNVLDWLGPLKKLLEGGE